MSDRSYMCSRCEKVPMDVKEIFTGCKSCGNRFFRIIEQNIDQVADSTKVIHIESDGIADIRIIRPGVFELEIDNLLKRKDAPLVMSNDKPGKYAIKLS